ncbi:MAG: hypothetical protein ACJ0HG_03415 [Alphaproteobacteria bacterium]
MAIAWVEDAQASWKNTWIKHTKRIIAVNLNIIAVCVSKYFVLTNV